ncbi:MAG: hypothetical protein K2K21_09655 [Lachnospiraceae bacterium]|nr:hypothetical protein [Lachnospiraceae bacterium]
MNIDELREKYDQWWGSRDADTCELHMQILQYELEYFKDMLLKDSDLKKYATGMDGDNECSFEDVFNLHFDLENNKYTYYIMKLEDCAAECNREDRTITFDPEYASNKTTILHEMIHAYENIIDSMQLTLIREIIFLHLYNKLKPEIPDLDDKIAGHANILSGMDIYIQGGKHDILFYLKSLDLDLRCGYKLGTVCGYDRDKE